MAVWVHMWVHMAVWVHMLYSLHTPHTPTHARLWRRACVGAHRANELIVLLLVLCLAHLDMCC